MKRIALLTAAVLVGVVLCEQLMQAAEPPTAVPTSAKAPTTREGKTDAAGFIPYWVGLEPLDISADEAGGRGADKDYLPGGEAKLTPTPGDTVTVGSQKKLWKPIASSVHTPIVDLDDLDGATYNAVSYLVSYVKLDKEEPKATIAWSTDDGGTLFVNGKEVDRFPKPRSCPIDGSVVKDIPLNKGVNVIVLKILNGYGNFSGVVRLVDSIDHPIAGATILMAPEGKQAPKDATWYVIDTGSKPLEGTFSDYLKSKPK
jgi:hypothetical protein